MEAFQSHGSNIVILQLTSGDRRWYILGCYLAPGNASTVEDVVAAIVKRPQGGALVVVGDFNTNLDATLVGERYEGIELALAEEGMEGISGRFIPGYNPWLKYGCTW